MLVTLIVLNPVSFAGYFGAVTYFCRSLWKKAQKSATVSRDDKKDDPAAPKEADNSIMSFTAVVNAEVPCVFLSFGQMKHIVPY